MDSRSFLSKLFPPEPKQTADEIKRRISIITVFSLLAGVIALIVAPEVYEKYSGFLAVIPYGYVATLLLLYIAHRLFGSQVPYVELNVAATSVVIIYGVCTGGIDNSGHLWSFVYIPATAYALGHRRGMCVQGVLFLLFCYALFVPGNPFLIATYTTSFKLRFALAFALASITTYLIELALVTAKLSQIRLMEELRTLNDKKNEYLGIVAHDLRNPLTILVGLADLLVMDIRRGLSDSKQAVAELQKISSVGTQMSQMLHKILDISAIESGRVRMDLQTVDLNQLVFDSAQLHRRAASNKNIELTIENDPDLPTMKIDPLKITSVIDNLLSNAVKYTHPNGRVKVSFEKSTSEVVTHIQDTGQGLNATDLKTVFTSFTRLSAKPTGGEPSTGLGLAIVKKIVEMHGGRVWVVSTPNVGSTFSFSLPTVAAALDS